MSNFKCMLNDVLIEKGKTFGDLENAGIICERTFYQYKDFTPYLQTVIKIANYLNVSIDYIVDRTAENNFKRYSETQLHFCENLLKIMKVGNISQCKIADDLQIGRSNFVYWRRGRSPKLNTLIELANYLNCNIDDLLDTE